LEALAPLDDPHVPAQSLYPHHLSVFFFRSFSFPFELSTFNSLFCALLRSFALSKPRAFRNSFSFNHFRTLFENCRVAPYFISQKGSKMNEQSPNSNPINELPRCQHRTATGRRCRHASSEASTGLCARHIHLRHKNSQDADLTADLLGELQQFQSASDVNQVLGKLFMALTRNRIATRRAAVLAYIGNMLLRSVTAIDRENKSENTPIVIDIPSAVARRALGHLGPDEPHSATNPS
jgi:hypothetical protein